MAEFYDYCSFSFQVTRKWHRRVMTGETKLVNDAHRGSLQWKGGDHVAWQYKQLSVRLIISKDGGVLTFSVMPCLRLVAMKNRL